MLAVPADRACRHLVLALIVALIGTGLATAALGLLACDLAAGAASASFPALLSLWFALGVGTSIARTPGGRLLKRSSQPERRPAVFAAPFALPRARRLPTDQLAGWIGANAGLPATFPMEAMVAGLAIAATLLPRPRVDDAEIEHTRPIVVDRLHPHWPDPGQS